MQPVPQQPPLTKKKSKGWIVALVVGVVVVLGGAIALAVFFFSALSGPTNVAKSFLSDVNGGKQHQAYESTASIFKNSTTEEQFNTFIEQYPIFTSLSSFSFGSVEVQSSNGLTVGKTTATLKGKDGSSQDVLVTLVKEESGWKVATVEFAPAASKTE